MKFTLADWNRIAWPLGITFGYANARIWDGKFVSAFAVLSVGLVYCAIALHFDRKDRTHA